MRQFKRKNDELRPVSIDVGILPAAEGSALVKFGNTHVICSASVDEHIPFFRKGKGGWVTAEYGMLPRSTSERMKREATQGKQSGRTQEIQRLIGRSLRAVIDLNKLGDRQILIDCDVLNADGGTRTASITGAYVALYIAVSKLMSKGLLKQNPIIGQVAAISCGIRNDEVILDLDYIEDSDAEVDANFVLSADGNIIELQSSAEKKSFTEQQLYEMLKFVRKGTLELFKLQNKSILRL